MPFILPLLSLFKGISSSMYLYIAIGILVAGFGLYYNHAQHVQDDLKKTIILDKVAIDSQKNIITDLKHDIEQIKDINDQISKLKDTDIIQKDKLNKALSKLEKTAAKKAQLVENIINKASKERNRCIEIATGDEPVKGETNSVCPQLVK